LICGTLAADYEALQDKKKGRPLGRPLVLQFGLD
jgi:hypothetical protein